MTAVDLHDDTPEDTPARPSFPQGLYAQIDAKLRATHWNSGASEAHGLLSGLACCGVRDDQIRSKAWLLRLSDASDLDLIEGLYGMLSRDLRDPNFAFTLLLPEADAGAAEESDDQAQKIESLTDWCGGFLQGFLHDGEGRLDHVSAAVREAIDDIIAISQLSPATRDEVEPEAAEGQFSEIEEYLRVATQVIFEELNPAEPRTPTHLA